MRSALALGAAVLLLAALPNHPAPAQSRLEAGSERAQADPPQVEAGVAPGTVPPDTRPGEAFADPKVAALQRTATDVQRELATLSQLAHTAQDELDEASAQVTGATTRRAEADRAVAEQQAEVDAYTSALYSTLGKPDAVRVLLTAGSPDDFLAGNSLVGRLRADLDARLGAAVDRQRAAAKAEIGALGAQRTASERRAELDRRSADASNRAAAVSSELRGKLADTDAAVVALQKAQLERNTTTAANWKAYTDRLAAAKVVLPKAVDLRDPDRLPAGLLPLVGTNGARQPGVAQVVVGGDRLLVLPEETQKAVTLAIGALGKPYVPGVGGEGPTAYSCDGLVRAAYASSGIPLPGTVGEQYGVLAPVTDPRPGDVVFIGPARLGAQSVGIVLDEKSMLVADARLAGVVVADLPGADTVLGFGRPSLALRDPQAAPKATDGGLTWRCGGVQLPARSAGEAASAWGGYPNGLIPLTALCPIGVGSHALRCDAAQGYQAMSAAFGTAFGRPLCVTDSYRAYAAQVQLYAVKPALAAVPGTSNHGWGLAVDLCGGVQTAGSAEYAWMIANAPAFGWSNPLWARRGGGREEPWHWEYVAA
ncbi:D-alanyl-D-alanine carboxypeptidase family protein [Actinokineospora terrae]|uniref:NlpC/P60 family protein n=1 Tax=Actinokineospora terrae TaxID=155974 RepID=A0A1H9NPB3_9PSEU|nr:D-alanyl-D-alanine carboxypeptidase family protein [Actinokineospora terrae]SER37854.1 NlpC/P60 family protein [Actinokineospora terrae]